jgi:ubiquinone/menaquinone biosynthesis C-methylase UbiE
MSKTAMKTPRGFDHAAIRKYYDEIYYHGAQLEQNIPGHYRRLASLFQPWRGKNLLDVGCGTGAWLRAAAASGACPAGVDISQIAIEACRRLLPEAELHCSPAERLPFADDQFDFVSCLGAIEHFIEPEAALREMIRVAKPDAVFLLLVPNADFLPRRLGLYAGTDQATIHEEVRSLQDWQKLFESVGLRVRRRWKDLHVLSPSWIFRGHWRGWPLRAAQALALPLWPLSWQYQVYHQCHLK